SPGRREAAGHLSVMCHRRPSIKASPVTAGSPIIFRIDGDKSPPSHFFPKVSAHSFGGFAMSDSAQYPGYRIENRTIDDHWMVSVFPKRANLPSLKSVPFHQFPRPQTEVLAEAKRRIDRVLSNLKQEGGAAFLSS